MMNDRRQRPRSLWLERLGAELLKPFSAQVRARAREPLFLRMLLAGLPPGGTLVEIGSSDGCETIEAFRSGRCERAVIIEPDARNIASIRAALAAARIPADKVDIVNGGISDVAGVRPFYLHPTRSNFNSALEAGPDAQQVDVRFVTLPQLLAEQSVAPPLLIKMDIEGYEVEVLKGAMDYLLQHPSVAILMELHPQLYDAARSLGAQMGKLLANGYQARFVESAGTPVPPSFKRLGLSPRLISGRRGLYHDVAPDDALALCCRLQPEGEGKAARSVLLAGPAYG